MTIGNTRRDDEEFSWCFLRKKRWRMKLNNCWSVVRRHYTNFYVKIRTTFFWKLYWKVEEDQKNNSFLWIISAIIWNNDVGYDYTIVRVMINFRITRNPISNLFPHVITLMILYNFRRWYNLSSWHYWWWYINCFNCSSIIMSIITFILCITCSTKYRIVI